ncbi:MAG: hypothetical protein JOY71_06590 [Acetobacteraceae bacterium]|nr:hypothetical protein [Acetobacteraceae bacterium]
MILAAAPASRNGFHALRIAFELPVACTPRHRVCVELLVGGRMFEPHLLQIHIQLFSDQHRD